MKRSNAGRLDRRIQIQVLQADEDAAGDPRHAWIDWQKLWSAKKDRGNFREISAPEQVLRDSDTAFEVRSNSISRAIFPETHRVLYQSRIYEIIGIGESATRGDMLHLMTASRPDGRGARGPVEGTSA